MGRIGFKLIKGCGEAMRDSYPNLHIPYISTSPFFTLSMSLYPVNPGILSRIP